MGHADREPTGELAERDANDLIATARAMSRPLAMIVATCLLLAVGSADTAAQPDCVTIEDFSKAKVGEFPTDWKPRKDAGKDVYRVAEEPNLRFLHAAARGLGIQAAKQHEWDLGAYPVLTWS